MFKAIIIGCGKIAGYFDSDLDSSVSSHARAYDNVPNIDVVAFIDTDLDKAQKLAKIYNCDSYGNDYISFINKHRPDVVSVCTPDNTHFEIINRMLINKVTPSVIFVEKPICSNSNEFNKIKLLSKRKNVAILINHSRRFNPKYINLKKMIQRNVFGKLIRADVFYYGGWKHNGVHVIDTLLFLFNENLFIRKIYGYMTTQYQNDLTLDVELLFDKNKAKIYLHAFDEKYYQLFDFDFKFEKARLKIENFENRYIFDEKFTNSKMESELIPRRLNLGKKNSSCIQNAINVISRYLKLKKANLIKDYSIDEAKTVMNIIWKGEKYASRFKK
ncbi:hypothetical protein A2230_08360 [candidate division WOR-1 bacterium RIFOXYA2_FULL_36_21]|uniref:Gfo/Idh/MocA-like oxidoreductase N-terminal domain-containing protein n=1 Tax=candidate division WOR-1 bacterium RIFOXYB2_FULL_36_35 TaxID=1802578 RepID=A0A1F4S8C7_UNCSA|nr:MAG: hypothetical protein A2230_08360 [candidate division WOR-1 bacterium RIFOXYA2_FULL_36_21]OGC15322.1 MAG: hypothetical protein A2282_06110 [candidate division WOR-1 bacterium RIFOXYA12_FULL_36_13]OGC16664.1 MAG: hypothetical protein A2290_03575 [candidate division WOR-1 bacterium RIFOXYB2_FULL_36_35]